MNDIEKAIKRVHIKDPILSTEDGIYKMTQRIFTEQVEAIDDAIIQEVIKCLPDDVTDVILLDKKKITEIFMKQIPKKPTQSINGSTLYCPGCKKVWVNSNNDFCHRCGQALDWTETTKPNT